MEVGVSKSVAPHCNRGENSPCSIRFRGIPRLGHSLSLRPFPSTQAAAAVSVCPGASVELLLQDSVHAGPCIAFPHAPLGLTLLPPLRCWMPRPLTTANQSQLLSPIPSNMGQGLWLQKGLQDLRLSPQNQVRSNRTGDQFLFCFSLFPSDRILTV